MDGSRSDKGPRPAPQREEAGQGSARGYTVECGDCPLFVCEVGSGRPVVVLHGGPGASHDYLYPSFSRLADEFHLYFYDQRGGGRSSVPRPTEIGWRHHVADLESLRHAWGFERLTLAAYSWGALLALLYAAEYPERVRALALVAPATGWGDYHRRFREEFERRSRSALVMRMRAELDSSGLEEQDTAAYWQRRFILSVAGYFRDPREARDVTPFVVQEQARQATWASLKGQGPELRRRLETVDVPTLILHGRYDPIPMEWAEELAALLPAARLVVLEQSGHLPYLEQAGRTFAEIRGFLHEEAGS
ncbi:MAG: alpha/beta hydrolase [Gemmatimonadota bacterium]|nr:MAG: alpha/beta hydrolase [Gemmatimonadota bacterium]